MNRLKREEALKKWGPSATMPGFYSQTFEHAVTNGNLTLAQELINYGVFWVSPKTSIFHALNRQLNSIFSCALQDDDLDLTRWILEHPNIRLSENYKAYCLIKSLVSGFPRGRAWSLLAQRINLETLGEESPAYDASSVITWLISSNCEAAVRYVVAVLLKNTGLTKSLGTSITNLDHALRLAVLRDWLNIAWGLVKINGNDFSALNAHEIQDVSTEMLVMLFRRGWRPVRSQSPKVLEKLAAKLEQAGYVEESLDFRERSHKIIARRLAKELERY
jgi:hypothetical protein